MHDVDSLENSFKKKLFPIFESNFCGVICGMFAIMKTTIFCLTTLLELCLNFLEIRRQSFRKTPQRYAEDYFKYTGEYNEHQTTFFPVHPNVRYPKRYNVNNVKDEEWCEKDFPRAHDFADGIFSIGCPCAMNVTYGFELNLKHESGRNFFRFLTCRKVNFKKLKGIIYDFSCGLQRYCL